MATAARPAAARTWGRQQQHDDRAVPLVDAAFAARGYTGYAMGTEHDPAALRDALRQHTDATSLLIRFRPDRVYVHSAPARRTIVCEIKSEAGRSLNFALEADSFAAARAWNQQGSGHQHVCFALVDLALGLVVCAWADALPLPATIYVPQRWDWQRTMARLRQEWPASVRLEPRPHTGGAGTAYLLLPKSCAALRPMDSFLRAAVP